MRTLNFFQHALDDNGIQACKGGTIIAMQGYRRLDDFYLCIPKKGFYYRSANCHRYGDFSYEYFFNGKFLGGGRMYKKDKIKALCEIGEVGEAEEYLHGYRYWRETTLGGRHIIKVKEKARISHQLCDTIGKAGHDHRQFLRKFVIKVE